MTTVTEPINVVSTPFKTEYDAACGRDESHIVKAGDTMHMVVVSGGGEREETVYLCPACDALGKAAIEALDGEDISVETVETPDDPAPAAPVASASPAATPDGQPLNWKCECGQRFPSKSSLGQHSRTCDFYLKDGAHWSPVASAVVTATASAPSAPAIIKPAKVQAFLSAEGKRVMELMVACYQADRTPTMLMGGTGLGKSFISRLVQEKVGARGVSAVNLTPHTRMEHLVGQLVPDNGPSGVILTWRDGVLTDAARNGYIMLLEEITRSPDTMSRIFSLTDQAERSLPLAENPWEPTVAVHPDFWLVASGNPAGGKYKTAPIDAALKSRFFLIDCSKPLADEQKVLESKGLAPDKAKKLVSFADTLRSKGEFYVSTRDLLMAGSLMQGGMNLSQALDGAITKKANESSQPGIETLIKGVF